jgi:hypothetical protein
MDNDQQVRFLPVLLPPSLPPSPPHPLTHPSSPSLPLPQNPPSETKWWEAYYPSQEEQEAAAAGFDFANPEKWLEGPKEAGKMDPPAFEASEGFTYAGREWPELKKVVKA